ncbi:CPBP family intramembrane glutamic endopeptidase [Stratiformator vulcanicus]|uniref:CAAX amino terminal protease self-immunity n=1 Tax=Stratiformator vulcanicus TaxID=2527980 RepID=A0A517R3J3_9PLAN|nr:JDVT-CTERM system glutamic-type intramembrane protease [Stratiformator vulcanicus]QDT38426.1 CAAX amino terminal protease self- immunity [Stratiformator vulcanicus]
MPDLETINSAETIALLGVVALVGWSGYVWWGFGLRLGRGKPALPRRGGPRGAVHPFPLVLVSLWWLFTVAALIAGGLELTSPPDPEAVIDPRATTILSLGVGGLLLGAIVSTSDLRGVGLRFGPLDARRIGVEFNYALKTFAATVLPTAILLIVMSPWRTTETQHPYFEILTNGSPELRFYVAFSVLIGAPLLEELIFRVTMQRWIGRLLSLFDITAAPATWSIVLTAALFAAVHGMHDAIPLMPLALALGWLYEQRNSVISIMLVHSVFNATFLALALLGA